MEQHRRTFFERAKKTVKKQGSLFAAVAIMGGLFVGISAPVHFKRDDSCRNNGEPVACGFDMKWTKSQLSCVLIDTKTLVTQAPCTQGGSDCVPGYYKSGSSFQGKVRFEIAGPAREKDTWTVLLVEGPIRSHIEIPSCK